MANLTFTDVLIIGAVATVGFTLVSWWFSSLMANKNWSLQIRAKAKGPADRPAEPTAQKPQS